MYSGEFEMIQY